MRINERNEILAIFGNAILLEDGEIAVIGNINRSIEFTIHNQEIEIVQLKLHFGNNDCDRFVFKNKILSNFEIKEGIAPNYIINEIYSNLKPGIDIPLTIFSEELIKLFVLHEMGFMDM